MLRFGNRSPTAHRNRFACAAEGAVSTPRGGNEGEWKRRYDESRDRFDEALQRANTKQSSFQRTLDESSPTYSILDFVVLAVAGLLRGVEKLRNRGKSDSASN